MTLRTPNRSYPYPEGNDPYVLTADLAELAKALDTDVNGLDSGASSVTSLNDLSDVDLITSPAVDGQVLIFDAATGKWKAATTSTTGGATSLNGLSDVDTFTNTPTEGQVLRYNEADAEFVPYTPVYGATSMNELTDVDLDVFIPEDGHVLVYRAGKYVSEVPPAGGATEIPEKVMEWEGQWATGTAYQTGDVVKTATGAYVAKADTSADPDNDGGSTVLFNDTFDTDLSAWDVPGSWAVNAGVAEIISTSFSNNCLLKYLQEDGTATFSGVSYEGSSMSSDLAFGIVAPNGAGYSYNPKTGAVNRWDGSVSANIVEAYAFTVSDPWVAPVNVAITKNGGEITIVQDGVTIQVTDPEPLAGGTGWGAYHYYSGSQDRTALAGFSFSVEEPPAWEQLAATNPPILTSPNGTHYRLTVDDAGVLSTTVL